MTRNRNREYPATTHAPLSGAERQRLRRERQKAGLAVFHVECNVFELSDFLVEAGALPAWDQDDPQCVRQALEEYLRARAQSA